MSHVGEGLSRLLYTLIDVSYQLPRPPFARSRILPPDGRSLLLAWVGAALKVLKEKSPLFFSGSGVAEGSSTS